MDTIDLNITLHRNHDTFTSINNLGFNQRRAVWVYVDDDIRGFDLGPAGVGNVGYHQGCILTGGGFVALVESFHFFFFDTAFLEETFHFWFGENSGFRRILL